MPFPVGAAIAAGAAIAGQGIQMGATKLNNTKNFNRTKKLMDKQQSMNEAMALMNQKAQLQMWKDTGPVGQMEQLKLAGLNPGLIYGMGGAGGQTAQAAQGAPVSGGTYRGDNPGEGLGITGQIVGEQLALMQAQKENIQADTANKQAGAGNLQADTLNKPKVGENLEANTAKTIADTLISQYAGKEAKDQYEQVKSPNRGIEAKTYQDELEAKQGIAGTIYEMWTAGLLHEKALNEVEQVVLANAKTRAETKNIIKSFDLLEQNLKGAKLDNVIKELEAQLQTKTGIDKTSNGLLKILGRLFIQHTQ